MQEKKMQIQTSFFFFLNIYIVTQVAIIKSFFFLYKMHGQSQLKTVPVSLEFLGPHAIHKTY